MTDAGAGALTDDLSSAITFVIYGMGSFCILTAYSTVLRNLHTTECTHKLAKEAIEGHGGQTPHDATEPSTDLPCPASPSHVTGDEYTELPPPHVPYWSLMPKHTTLQEHHAPAAPVYTCVCQLPVAIPVAHDNVWATTSYPDAKTITCEPLLGSGFDKQGFRDLRRAATLYENDSTFGVSRCRSVSCPAARSLPPSYAFSAPSGEKKPLDTIASPPTAPAKASIPPVVTLALTAQADTRDRRERSLYRASFQVGLPLSSVALGDVYSIRVELNCPDNAQSHLLPSVMWCFTSTLAEIKKTRDSMQHEVQDDLAATVLAKEIESSQDMQHFLDAVAKNRVWADAPSLRKFCQMW